MIKRKVSVKLLGDAKEEYLKLRQIVKLEKSKGIKKSFNQTLFRGVEEKIGILKNSCDYGTQIPKKQIPKKYFEQYEVTNLWKIGLPDFWRMIYTLKQPQREISEVDIIDIWLDVLDIIDHNKYNKIFGYRKR